MGQGFRFVRLTGRPASDQDRALFKTLTQRLFSESDELTGFRQNAKTAQVTFDETYGILARQVKPAQSRLDRLASAKARIEAELQRKCEFSSKLEQNIQLKGQLNQQLRAGYDRAKRKNQKLVRRVHQLETALVCQQPKQVDVQAEPEPDRFAKPCHDPKSQATVLESTLDLGLTGSLRMSCLARKVCPTDNPVSLSLDSEQSTTQARPNCSNELARQRDLSPKKEQNWMTNFDTRRDHLDLLRDLRVRRVIRSEQKSIPTRRAFFSQMCEWLDAGANTKRRRVALAITREKLYLFDPETYSLRASISLRHTRRVGLSQTNFAILSFHQSRPELDDVVIRSLARAQIVMFIVKLLGESGRLPAIERMSNPQICSQMARVLDQQTIPPGTNLMWARAEHKHRVEWLSRSVFADSWEPGYLLVCPKLVVFHRRKLSVSHPLVVPLYALFVRKGKRSKDPAEVRRKEHVFSLMPEGDKDPVYFACESESQKREILAALGRFVECNGAAKGQESLVFDQLELGT